MNSVGISVFVLVMVVSMVAGQSCPKMIDRAGWNARPAWLPYLTTRPAPYVIIHHTVTGPCSTQAQCSSIMRGIQNHHMDVNGWPDIGYNYAVGGDGLIYEARGFNRAGAHTVDFNFNSIGIAFIGDFTSQKPPIAAIKAAQALIACGVARGEISTKYKLLGHGQLNPTACPGGALLADVKKWWHWSATA